MKSRVFLKEKAIHGTALMPIAIHHLSYRQNTDNFFYLHWHDEFEFVVVLEGAMIYTIEDKEYNVMAGEGLFIHSNKLHAARAYMGLPCEACVVLFHPGLFGGTHSPTYSKFLQPFLKGELNLCPRITPAEEWQQTILRLILEMDSFRKENLMENELLIKSRIFEMWHLCYEHAEAAQNLKDKNNYKLERLQPVIDYIHTNYREEISLASLTGLLPMSEGQFCHTFKEVIGMPPIAYVIRHRILQSCSLLTQTDWKISEVARITGFNNISYFNREFKKAIGCSPGEYRKEG